MNNDFIRRATRVTSFNFYLSDFQSTTHKKEIQTLFNTHFFPNFKLSNTVNEVNKNKLNAAIDKLRKEDYGRFMDLHKYNMSGIGPGEVTLYFLINNAKLGGGSSAGVDVVVGSKSYEVKAVDVSQGYATNFKTGGTFDVSDIINELMQLKKDVGAGGEGVNKNALDLIRRKFPEKLKSIQERYRERAYKEYFSKEEIIFIRNGGPKNTIGDILAVKKVQKHEIELERITSGVIKPMVKL